MTRRIAVAAALVGAVALAATARAHITPPVVLLSDRDAIAGQLSGAKKFFVREVRLTDEERKAIQSKYGWKATEDFHRFYLGRDADGKLVAASIFMTEGTMHGPVRVAVGLTPDGKVKGARVVELSEESYVWVKPLIDRNFTTRYAGLDASSPFGLSGTSGQGVNDMSQFYGTIVGSLVQRAAILYDVAITKRGGA